MTYIVAAIVCGLCALVLFGVGLYVMSHDVGRLSAEDEKQFRVLLQWERDGIFPRIYGHPDNQRPDGTYRGPDWYEAEKQRRGLSVMP